MISHTPIKATRLYNAGVFGPVAVLPNGIEVQLDIADDPESILWGSDQTPEELELESDIGELRDDVAALKGQLEKVRAIGSALAGSPARSRLLKKLLVGIDEQQDDLSGEIDELYRRIIKITQKP